MYIYQLAKFSEGHQISVILLPYQVFCEPQEMSYSPVLMSLKLGILEVCHFLKPKFQF